FEVDFPVRVVGVGFALDFHVPLDRGFTRFEESDRSEFSVFTDVFGGKDPVPAFLRLPVRAADPPFSFVAVAPQGPPPQCGVNGVIYLAEGPLADDVPVIVRPTPNDRVQTRDHGRRWRAAVPSDGASDLLQERFHVRLGRRNQEDFAAAVLAYILVEEVEAVFT